MPPDRVPPPRACPPCRQGPPPFVMPPLRDGPPLEACPPAHMYGPPSPRRHAPPPPSRGMPPPCPPWPPLPPYRPHAPRAPPWGGCPARGPPQTKTPPFVRGPLRPGRGDLPAPARAEGAPPRYRSRRATRRAAPARWARHHRHVRDAAAPAPSAELTDAARRAFGAGWRGRESSRGSAARRAARTRAGRGRAPGGVPTRLKKIRGTARRWIVASGRSALPRHPRGGAGNRGRE